MTDGHILVCLNLGYRPAVYLFRRSRWASAAQDAKLKVVTRIVEMNELLQAFDVAVVEERLLEVRSRGFRGRALGRHQGHVACRGRLKLTFRLRPEFDPVPVRIRTGTETASQERC